MSHKSWLSSHESHKSWHFRSNNYCIALFVAMPIIQTTLIRARVLCWIKKMSCLFQWRVSVQAKIRDELARRVMINQACVTDISEHVSSSALSLNALHINHLVCFCSWYDTEWAQILHAFSDFIRILHGTRTHDVCAPLLPVHAMMLMHFFLRSTFRERLKYAIELYAFFPLSSRFFCYPSDVGVWWAPCAV